MKFILIACFILLSPLSAEWDPQKLQQWEKDTISDIFTTIAEKSLPSLLFDSLRLTRLGEKIQHLPPLQFLGYIMTTPRLKECIHTISHSYFKWPFFMDGVQNTLERAYFEGSLFSDLPEFAKLTGSDYEKLRECCENRGWEEFVKALL